MRHDDGVRVAVGSKKVGLRDNVGRRDGRTWIIERLMERKLRHRAYVWLVFVCV